MLNLKCFTQFYSHSSVQRMANFSLKGKTVHLLGLAGHTRLSQYQTLRLEHETGKKSPYVNEGVWLCCKTILFTKTCGRSADHTL